MLLQELTGIDNGVVRLFTYNFVTHPPRSQSDCRSLPDISE
jgi:hypothetical protein